MSYTWQWGVILSYKEVFLRGALTTLELSALVIVIGIFLGFFLTIVEQSLGHVGQRVIQGGIELLRTIPILILLIWIHYVLPLLIGVHLSAFQSGCIALSMNLSAFVAPTLRAGIISISCHQRESGLALGLNERQVLWLIILPQALKNILPNLVNLSITQIKNTALASIIGVDELLHQGNLVMSNTFRPLEIYTAIAAMYTCLILPFAFIGKRLERRLHPI